MASNDGARLTVFGLGYRQHDTRKMHRILDHYERLPDNANDRVALYTTLTALARDIPAQESQSLENWLANGGDFPFQRDIRQPTFHGGGGFGQGWPDADDDEDEDEDEEPDYGRHHPRHPIRGGMGRHAMQPRHIQRPVAPPEPWMPRGNHFGGGRTLGAPEGELDPILANDTPQVPAAAATREDENDDLDEEEEEQEEVPPPPRHLRRNPRHNHRPNNPLVGHNIPADFPGHGPLQAQVHGLPGRDNFGHGPPPFGLARDAGRLPVRRGGAHQMFGHPGGLDPFMGHGPPMGFDHNATVFDAVGPGRRLGEEGEDTTVSDRNIVDPVEEEQFEEIFHDAHDNQDEEMEDEEEEEEGEVELEPLPAFDPTPALPDIECGICYEDLATSDFPSGKITAVCKHKTKACFGCLETTISVQVTEGVLGQLNCPLCPEKLSYEDIREYASPEVFQRYDYLLSRTNKDMFMCLAPNCGAGQIHTGGKEQPMMICNACDFKICTYHGRSWHENQTCAEFDVDPSQIERLEEEEATAKMLAKDSRICPKCNQGVSKSEGCDHMQCRCGNAFCFICEAEWENIIRLGGYGHARTCPYNPQFTKKGKTQLEADGSRALHAVHGGAISEELLQARAAHQETRRATMRPLAAEAAEKRMKEMREGQKDDQAAAAPKKRKINLKSPWEEGGNSRRAF